MSRVDADIHFRGIAHALQPWPAECGTTPIIPAQSARKVQIDHDRIIYRQRHVTVRMVRRFKDEHLVVTRLDRNIKTFMAIIATAASVTSQLSRARILARVTLAR